MSKRRKVVIIGPGDSIYVKGFFDKIIDKSMQATLITNETSEKDFYIKRRVDVVIASDIWGYDKKCQEEGKRIAEAYIEKNGRPDACMIHYSHFGCINTFHEIWKKARKRTLVYWGSDFYMLPSNREKMVFKYCLEASRIDFMIPSLRNDFFKRFSPIFCFKSRVVDFGMNLYDDLKETIDGLSKEACKTKYRLPIDKTIIHIGYGSGERQNHIAMITELKHLPMDIKDSIYLVIPFSFSNNSDYEIDVKNALAESGIKGELKPETLNKKDVSEFRNTADVFLYAQETDAGSQSVLEYAFVGAKIVFPKRLLSNYKVFQTSKYKVWLYKENDEVAEQLIVAIKSDLSNGNIEYLRNWIYYKLSWDGLTDNWKKML